MTQITNEQLKFMWEAKKVFEAYPNRETHRNEDETLIALRMGEDRDCVMIYKLDGYVANFVQQMKPKPGVRPSVLSFAYEMERQLKANDHKGGWRTEHWNDLVFQLERNIEVFKTELFNKGTRYFNPQEVTIRAANIANYSMMIADNEGDPL